MQTTRRGRLAGRREGLTTADLVVLSLLAERPMHGYDLLGEYRRQEVADWASISKAQLYYALKKLEGLGLLSSRSEEGVSRDRLVYRPSRSGLEALDAGLSDVAWSRGRVAQPFLTWFGLSIHTSAAGRDRILRERLVFLDEELARERKSLAYIKTLNDARASKGAAIVRLTIRQLRIERRWVKELVAAL